MYILTVQYIHTYKHVCVCVCVFVYIHIYVYCMHVKSKWRKEKENFSVNGILKKWFDTKQFCQTRVWRLLLRFAPCEPCYPSALPLAFLLTLCRSPGFCSATRWCGLPRLSSSQLLPVWKKKLKKERKEGQKSLDWRTGSGRKQPLFLSLRTSLPQRWELMKYKYLLLLYWSILFNFLLLLPSFIDKLMYLLLLTSEKHACV